MALLRITHCCLRCGSMHGTREMLHSTPNPERLTHVTYHIFLLSSRTVVMAKPEINPTQTYSLCPLGNVFQLENNMTRSFGHDSPGSRGSDPCLVSERSRGPSPRPRARSSTRCTKVKSVGKLVQVGESFFRANRVARGIGLRRR
jgi:hypothetical protein